MSRVPIDICGIEKVFREGLGWVLDVEYYMRVKRIARTAYRMKHEFNRDFYVPACFDQRARGYCQHMMSTQFENCTVVTRQQQKMHRRVEQRMREIDDAPLRFCVSGCTRNCVVETPGVYSPIEQYYLFIVQRRIICRISQKPTFPSGSGVRDQHGNFVMEDSAFLRRRNNINTETRWRLKRELLYQRRLPHMMAEERLVVEEPQTSMKVLEMANQQCGSGRSVIQNSDWPGFERLISTIAPSLTNITGSLNSNSSGSNEEPRYYNLLG